MWIDVHAHLDALDSAQLDSCVAAALQSGVTAIVNTGTSLESSRRAAAQCEYRPQLYAMAGISPFDVNGLPPQWEMSLETILNSACMIGVGEVGIDATNPSYPSREAQLPVFGAQLALARRLGLPVAIHSRGSERSIVEMCRQERVTAALFHCFTGDTGALRAILDAGYDVSFSGIITFKNARIEPQVAYTPLDRLFIETDSPFLAPHPHRGKINQPAWVPLVGRRVAEIKKLPPETVAAALQSNFERLFGRATGERCA
jgi:TatD DNase family protein